MPLQFVRVFWPYELILRRVVIPLLVVMTLGWSYFSAVRVQRTVPRVKTLTTEEGQQVSFDKETYQFRELTKRLSLQEPWPSGSQLQQAFQRYGLDQNTPGRVVPVEIASNVYLVGQDRQIGRASCRERV